jgi:hypothetical protein
LWQTLRPFFGSLCEAIIFVRNAKHYLLGSQIAHLFRKSTKLRARWRQCSGSLMKDDGNRFPLSILDSSLAMSTGVAVIRSPRRRGQKRRRHVEAHRLRHDQVNDEVELRRLLDRKIGGLRPRKILSTTSPARR